MLHHLVFFNRGRPGAPRHDGTCPRAAQRFYGTSEELRPLTLPGGYGYRHDRRERWDAAWMAMNHTHQGRRAWIRYRVTIDTAETIRPVEPYWVSVVACGADPQYSVRGGGPAGSTSTRRVGWQVPVNGRLVAVGGHLHGGARGLTLQQPRCGARTLVTSRPTYGRSDDPVYRVRPRLHEPAPLSISWWQSSTGIAVRAGEWLTLGAHYDGQRPHLRVMGIDHVYLAPDDARLGSCDPLPGDAEELEAGFVGRPEPPTVRLTLARVGTDGRARAVRAPRGRVVRATRSAAVKVKNFAFQPAALRIPPGRSVRWRFDDRAQHDVTLVDGPRGFASPWSRRGASYTQDSWCRAHIGFSAHCTPRSCRSSCASSGVDRQAPDRSVDEEDCAGRDAVARRAALLCTRDRAIARAGSSGRP
jgi:plastocyanin